jgi:hypothetical protein
MRPPRPAPVAAPCPLCGSTSFSDIRHRRDAHCNTCFGLERHRALVRHLADPLALHDGRGRSAMEVGPVSPTVFGGFLRDRGWTYHGVDQSRTGNPQDPRDVRFADHVASLCDLARFDDGQHDLVIVQHVMEEVLDYQRALGEVARVLSPSGVAALEIFHNPELEVSRHRAQDGSGKVWTFGRDLPAAVRERFAAVDVARLREGDVRVELMLCRHAGAPVAA